MEKPRPYLVAHSDSDYLQALSEKIYGLKNPSHDLLGSVYTLDEETLCDALVYAGRNALGQVRLVMDEQQFRTPSSFRQPQKVVELLENGVTIRLGQGKTVHQKTWLIDGKRAFIGSGNATTNSRSRCYEFGIETTDAQVVCDLGKKLEELWDAGEPITAEDARGIRGRSSSSSRRSVSITTNISERRGHSSDSAFAAATGNGGAGADQPARMPRAC